MKLVKLSVAAAMAAGLATSASAVELTEAIKGVDLTGSVRYRLESIGGDNGMAGETSNLLPAATNGHENNMHDYRVRVRGVVPVNDDVNFVGLMGNFDDGANGTETSDTVYGNTNWGVLHAYFQYQGVENLTVRAGKQPIPTPFNDDEHGNGLVAMYNVGPVTLAGGYIDSHNAGFGQGQNIVAVGVIGAVEMVNFDVWYADHEDTFDAYTVDVNADIMDMVNVGVRHTELDLDAAGAPDNSLTKVYATADIDMFNVRAAYVKTDDEGGTVNYDGDAATGYNLEQADFSGLVDAKGFHIGAGATFDKFTVGLDYVDGETNNADFDEIMPSVSYAMSDNFEVSALYSVFDTDWNDETTLTRLQVLYTF